MHFFFFLPPCSENLCVFVALCIFIPSFWGEWKLEPPSLLPSSLILSGPHSEANPWESCTFPGRHSYVQIGGRKGTWVGSHQRNNMCARHRAGSRALRSEPQKARNYCCLSFSITESLNTSGGTTRPPPRPLQLGGKLSLSNNPQWGYFLLVQGHLK